MKHAAWYKQRGNRVHCMLCPHNCVMLSNEYGKCNARIALNSGLFSENYGKMCSMAFDPIEKKPLFHFFPGHSILSVGTIGCNLSCTFCQNYEISQCKASDMPDLRNITAELLVNYAKRRHDNAGIAFTYNEPVIWFEFVKETAALAKENALKTVMVTNGFINSQPLNELLPIIDAFNVDLKSFDSGFYRSQCNGWLSPVLDTLVHIRKSGRHLEITNLIIPGLNDDSKTFSRMTIWIAENLGKETALHINRYSPQNKLHNPQTTAVSLLELYNIAKQSLNYVYIGNIMLEEGRHTYCPVCSNLAIERKAYIVTAAGLSELGQCKHCGKQIAYMD